MQKCWVCADQYGQMIVEKICDKDERRQFAKTEYSFQILIPVIDEYNAIFKQSIWTLANLHLRRKYTFQGYL